MSKELLIIPQQIIDAASGPVISYDEAAKLTGGLKKKKTLQNECSKGIGPKRIRIGKRVGFRTTDFAEWFCQQIRAI